MTVKINNVNYKINEVNMYDENLIVTGTHRCGSIHYDKGQIYIANYMSLDLKRTTLIHELTHAFLVQNGMANINTFSVEDVCELMSAFSERIVEITNEFYKMDGEDVK